ncbi:MAG: phosphotransferase [Ornithinimicrobium sp.]
MAAPPLRVLFDSVEEMLHPSSLTGLLGAPVGSVSLTPLESNGFSANQLSYVQAGGRRLVLKQLRSDDWLTRGSHDRRCRSVAVWRTGLLDRLKPAVHHPIMAASRDGTDHALLMWDCSAGLRRWGRSDRRRQLDQMVWSLATMHARQWNDNALADPVFGLADVPSLVQTCWPCSWPPFEDHPTARGLLQRGWTALLDLVAPDVCTTIEQIVSDPTALLRALEHEPPTLLHGDYRPDNVAVMADQGVVAFDWQLAGHGPGVLDLAWLINGGDTFAYRGWAFGRYRDYLWDALGDSFDAAGWERSLALANLTEVLRKGNWTALFAVEGDAERTSRFRAFIPAYNTFVREGAAFL